MSTLVQPTMKITHKPTLDLGLSAEFYGFEREVFRNKFSGVVRDTGLVNNSLVSQKQVLAS